ncbi:Asp23/Gls24 family envelope stress response protein [uncultured Acidaminococcus sp.]|uniref:Asp23/Gls24 family envelope stress response protein n=1 Tax=uncultured Acidaminococcus sp. TaxID=352152 RepID=UPI00266F0125|nr:Asp23/Gls24 family envelope stress response protein [uncultured Acidaminococcus sp.]
MNDEQEKQQAQLENSPDADDMGAIKVADEVLSIVAGLAASEVNGVYGMSGGIREGLTDMLGKQNFSKGIKVYTEGHTVRVEVHVIITYGFNIPDVAIKLQEKVKEAVENMTGYEVTGVDVHVEGVKKKKEKDFSGRDDTDELVKKWEEEPADRPSLPEGAFAGEENLENRESVEAQPEAKEAPEPVRPPEGESDPKGQETSGGEA